MERKDFDKLARYLELDPKAIENSTKKFTDGKSKILEMVDSSQMTSADKTKFQDLTDKRFRRLFGQVL